MSLCPTFYSLIYHFYIGDIAIAFTVYLTGVLSKFPAPKQSWELLCACSNLICGHILLPVASEQEGALLILVKSKVSRKGLR